MWEQLCSSHTLRSSLPETVERATNDPTSNDIYLRHYQYAIPTVTRRTRNQDDTLSA